MKGNYKNLFINGYGWTGSSAIIDYLSDFKNISIVTGEFEDLKVPYGIFDQVNIRKSILLGGEGKSFSNLSNNDKSSTPPSKRYRGLIPAINMLFRAFHIPIPFTKMWGKSFSYRIFHFKNFFYYLRESFITFSTYRTIKKSDSLEELNKIPNLWIKKISNIYGGRNQITCFDQAFIFDNLNENIHYLKEIKLAIVIRNPEKQFADILNYDINFFRNYPWRVKFLIGVDNEDLNRAIKIMINSTKRRLKEIIKLKKRMKNNLIFIDFDQFLINPEKQKKILENFVGEKFVPNKKKFFQIEKSRQRNTKLKINKGLLEAKDLVMLKKLYVKLLNL